ncbi:hypothetical protein [Muriicola marianensis]|uniref:hypothetical protein n=1 Tax=Muriicola marianensis TaxID=1324801 RepID=UPI00166F1E5C|nr:hypothetical protein [Muriicola marianensis]
MNIKKLKHFKNDLLAVIIIIIPLLIYSHLLFNGSNKYVELFGFKIRNWAVYDQVLAWFIINDIVIVLLLTIMFFNTVYKFKYFLIPLIVVHILSALLWMDIFHSFIDSIFSFDAFIISIFISAIILCVDFYRINEHQIDEIEVSISSLIKNTNNLNLKIITNKYKEIRRSRKEENLLTYLKKIFYWERYMANNHPKVRIICKSSVNAHSKIFLNNTCALIISILISLWFIHKLIPGNLNEIEILGINFDSHGFYNLQTFVWFISRKFIVICLLAIWFVTSPHWWRYAILSPLIIYSYQFWEAFQDVTELDSVGNLRVFPLVILNVALVITLSRFVKYRSQFMAVYEEISREVDEMLNEMKSKYPQEVGATLERIRKGKKGKEYRRQQLKALEEEIEARLDLTKG